MNKYLLHIPLVVGLLLVLVVTAQILRSLPVSAGVVNPSEIQFTPEEKNWLKEHPRIQIGVMDAWPPLNYLDQNKIPSGIGAEYLGALNKKLGGVLVAVPAQFKENYDRVLNGRLDALMDITQRPDREALFSFTRPYIVIPHTIVGRKDGVYFNSEKDLKGKTVALERGFFNVTHFRNNFPDVTIREYSTTSEALDAVSRGEADAYAGNRAVAIHLIEKELLNNLKLMGKLKEPKSTLQIAVAKNNPILAGILDKALGVLPETEQNAIYSKWVSLEYKQKVDYSVLWKVVTAALAVVIIFLLWNRQLGKEIAIRKKVEEELQANQIYLERLLQERTLRSSELEQAKEHAEASDQIKSAFLATMSHELRTPLNSIIGFTGILLQGMSGSINPEQAKQLSMVKNSANHLLSLISDVLDISKIEAGQLTLDSEPIDLRASILKIVQTVRPLAENKGLELTCDMGADVGVACADQRRVEQILLNLLSNSVKFTEQGSIIVSCVRQSDSYLTSVTDTGIGIKNDELERLFKPFHQVDNGTSRKFEGTGLGLSICKKLAELMGGEVGARSEYGKGSTFWFTLPVSAADEPSHIQKAALDFGNREEIKKEVETKVVPITAGSVMPYGAVSTLEIQIETVILKPAVLVVDDIPENLALLEAMLKENYEVKTASNGENAIRIARSENPPDLILLDIMMPGMDGFEVCRQLKMDKVSRDIPVIFLTARNETEDEQYGLELGAVDYITKPISPPIVMARVKNHLALKAAEDFLRDKNQFLEKEVSSRTAEVHAVQEVTNLALASLAETRDNATGNHLRRTQQYIKLLAQKLKSDPRFAEYLSDKNIALLFKSAPLHDIGKVGIPDRILLKPGRLEPEEFEIMKTHTTIGRDAIEHAERSLGTSVDFLRMAKEMILYHHEKWDGSGYPEGLLSEAIPFSARLMAVADVYDALISRRIYRDGLPHTKVVQMILDEKGTHFDPDIVDVFYQLQAEFREIASQYADAEFVEG